MSTHENRADRHHRPADLRADAQHGHSQVASLADVPVSDSPLTESASRNSSSKTSHRQCLPQGSGDPVLIGSCSEYTASIDGRSRSARLTMDGHRPGVWMTTGHSTSPATDCRGARGGLEAVDGILAAWPHVEHLPHGRARVGYRRQRRRVCPQPRPGHPLPRHRCGSSY